MPCDHNYNVLSFYQFIVAREKKTRLFLRPAPGMSNQTKKNQTCVTAEDGLPMPYRAPLQSPSRRGLGWRRLVT